MLIVVLYSVELISSVLYDDSLANQRLRAMIRKMVSDEIGWIDRIEPAMPTICCHPNTVRSYYITVYTSTVPRYYRYCTVGIFDHRTL
jgi:hypothetical protein